jgi:hypothetical protein
MPSRALSALLNHPDAKVQNAAWDVARYFELRALIDQALKDVNDDKLPDNNAPLPCAPYAAGNTRRLRQSWQNCSPHTTSPNCRWPLSNRSPRSRPRTSRPALLANWKGYLPDVRQKALNALLTNQERMKACSKPPKTNRSS